jgi:hypothetical protein
MRVSTLLAVLATTAACSSKPEPAPEFQGLVPPPAGQGLQISTGDFAVPAANEVQACWFYKVSDLAKANGFPADQPLILHRTEIAYKQGSHHMNIFRVRSIKELKPSYDKPQISYNGTSGDVECSKSANWADWPLIANNQDPGYFSWEYPEGVGNELMPEETIMLQSHYVNATTQATPDGAHVDVNFWLMKKEELKYQMGTLFATKQSIRICQHNPTPKFTGTCQIKSPTPVHIIGANGHFHSRGKKFDMYTWDGKSTQTPPEANHFYQSLVWDEPPMKHSPELDAVVPALGGLWYTCSFEWRPPPPSVGCEGLDALDKELFNTPDEALDCCYTFGNTVDRAEHCNNFVYYYPKADNNICY